VGNHEAVPVNEFAPRSIGGMWNMSWLYTGLAERWSVWLPSDAQAQVEFAGYYTTLTPDGVRIISLNTNLGCNSEDIFLQFPSSESADPDQQLHWLLSTLDSAEKNNEIVYIIQHINPSLDDCSSEWFGNYFKIINRYKNNILGYFAGHTHDDIFAVLYDLASDETVAPVSIAYFAGSVTPYSDENPGFRLFEIDSVTKAVIDYTEYAINLTQANIAGFPTWQPIYSARSAYSLPDMSPSSWHELSLRMGTNETLLYEYWERQGKLAMQGSCDAECLHGVWCGLWNAPPGAPSPFCGV